MPDAPRPRSSAPQTPLATQLASLWHERLRAGELLPALAELPGAQPQLACAALAELVTLSMAANERLVMVLPDDEWLPALSNALDLDLRPWCLVLPEADFAAAVTVRATLSLLKSRLSRPMERTNTTLQAIWQRQRAHLDSLGNRWQTALDWAATSLPSGLWPEGLAELFPVLILPLAQTATLKLPACDNLLLVNLAVEQTPLLTLARRSLRLRDPRQTRQRALSAHDETRRQRNELEMLAQELAELELEFATIQSELASFTQRYHRLVGLRLVEYDQLQARLTQHLARRAPDNPQQQQAAAQAATQAEQSRQENARFEEASRETDTTPPFTPSQDIRKLFRQLAQKIHPDRANDEEERAWRTELMSEANRAYREGDVMTLHDILAQWQASQESGTPPPPGASSSRQRSRDSVSAQLQAQINRLQARIHDISRELNQLLASRLYELYAAARLAEQQGRDLLKEMRDQLELQISAAEAQLQELDPA